MEQLSTNPTRIALYARGNDDDACDRQLEAMRRCIAASLGHARQSVIVDTHRDVGVAGVGVARLRDAIRAGRCDLLVVAKLDRLTRSLRAFADIYAEIEAHGAHLWSVGDWLDTSTSTGRAMVKLIIVFADFEKERISGRVAESLAARRAANDPS